MTSIDFFMFYAMYLLSGGLFIFSAATGLFGLQTSVASSNFVFCSFVIEVLVLGLIREEVSVCLTLTVTLTDKRTPYSPNLADFTRNKVFRLILK